MNEIESPIARVIDRYAASVAARDIEAFMALYDPAVRVFDAWGVWSYEGAPAWQVAVEGWFASHPGERFTVSFHDVRTVSTPAVASVTAVVTYGIVTSGGEPVMSMQNRLTWVLRTSGHVLRIVHEHTSAPIGFEDQKAMLQRPA
jgi:uncharacterized protein (TIGR02246 family)